MSKSELGEFWDKTKKVAGDVTENAKKDFAEVSAIAKKEFSEVKQAAEETIQMVADDVKVASQKVKAKAEDVVDDARVVAKDVDDFAGKTVVGAEELYTDLNEKLQVGKRGAGAAGATKVAYAFSKIPVAGKVVAVVGGAKVFFAAALVAGAVKGPKIIDKGQEWYKGHKEKRGSNKNNNTPN